jgi:CDP-glycerol glycerophosphotransferase
VRFSIITPVRNGIEFAEEYAASVKKQTFSDLEIIVVDDHSSDASVEAIKNSAGTDRRFQFLQLTDAFGVSAARNLGIRRASGEYLMFLDEDDALADSLTLEGLSRHLERAGDPDLLLFDIRNFDFARSRPCGLHPPTTGWRTVLRQHDGPVSVRSTPEVLRVSWRAGNMLYRRALVGACAITFPPGLYEDGAFCVLALLQARSISIYPTVCLKRRCCRPNSRSRSPGAQHLDVIAQYHRVARFLEGHPNSVTPPICEELRAKMLGFIAELAAEPSLIPTELLPQLREDANRLDKRLSRLVPARRLRSAAAGRRT